VTSRSKWLAAVSGWILGGASTALVVAATCSDCADVARRRSDLLWFAAWLALVYAVVFAVAGVVALVLQKAVPGVPTRTRRPTPASGAATASAHLCAAVLGAIAASVLMDAARILAERGVLSPRWLAAVALLLAAVAVVMALRQLVDFWARHGRASVGLLFLVPGIAAASLGASSIAVPRARPAAEAVLAAPAARGPVLVLGIDGADWRRIDALMERDRLPQLKKLVERGVRAPLLSTLPSFSPILWNTVATGADAATHGVLGFTEHRFPGLPCGVQRLPRWGLLREVATVGARHDRFQIPVSACRRRVKPIWTVLGEHDRRVAVINWYATWPAEPVNGYLLSDRNPRHAAAFLRRSGARLPQDVGVVYPADLWPLVASSDVPDLRPDEVLDLPLLRDLDPDARAEIARNKRLVATLGRIYLSDRFSAEIGLALLRREPIDFVAVYLAGIDHWSHRVGGYPQVIDRYYEYVDGVLGRYVAALPPEATIFLVSDHGWEYVSGPHDEEASGHDNAPAGILVAAGPEIAPGATLNRAPTLFDVAPTVLGLYGLPASQEMAGRVLDEMFTSDGRARVPSRRIASYGATLDPRSSLQASDLLRDGDAETLRKLRALGYIE
jgi:hypothetical protein